MNMKKEFLELENEVNRIIKDKEYGVIKNYSFYYKKLKKKINDIYDKYEKNGVFDYDEIKKYNRLKALDEYTSLLLQQLYLNNRKIINKTLNDVIDKAEKGSLSIFDGNISITPVKRNFDVTELINMEVAGNVWTERLKHHGNNFVYDVHNIVHHGLQNGDTYTQMSHKLKEQFGKDINKPLTIVRTESERVKEFTKFNTMKEVDRQVDLVKTWRTMADERVRSTHTAMEGISINMNEKFILPSGARCLFPKGTGNPSEDINCRCYLEFKPIEGYNERKDYLQDKLNFIDYTTNEKSFIPKYTLFESTTVIAKNETIRELKTLGETYGKGNWLKKAGKIESAKYIHDVHWYEKNGKQFKVKFKYRKEK